MAAGGAAVPPAGITAGAHAAGTGNAGSGVIQDRDRGPGGTGQELPGEGPGHAGHGGGAPGGTRGAALRAAAPRAAALRAAAARAGLLPDPRAAACSAPAR